MVSEWWKCSASCGGGWKHRHVFCQQLDARGVVRTVTEAACSRFSRPTGREQCTAYNCPTWVTSPWGEVHSNTEPNTCMTYISTVPIIKTENAPKIYIKKKKKTLYVTQFQCSGRCLDPTTTVQKRSVICQHSNGSSSHTDCDLRNRYCIYTNTENIIISVLCSHKTAEKMSVKGKFQNFGNYDYLLS